LWISGGGLLNCHAVFADQGQMEKDSSRSEQAPSSRRRMRVRNKVKAEPFVLLAEAVETAYEWTQTPLLLDAAGLSKDPEGGRGALKMLYVIGRAHARRGNRNSFEWRRGPLPDDQRPAIPLLPYQLLRLTLQRTKGNYLMTDEIMDESDLHDRPGILGALKVLQALGLVTPRYVTPRIVQWCFGHPYDNQGRVYVNPRKPKKPPPIKMESINEDHFAALDAKTYKEWLDASGF
jgi:hypothetical protein